MGPTGVSHRKRRHLTPGQRKALGGRCVNCGATENLTYHHIVPLAAGGRDTPDNMTCLCGKCHDMIHFNRAGRIDHNTLTKAGIHAAQARGVHFGRKALDYERFLRPIAERSTQFNPASTETEGEIAESLGLGTTTYYKAKRMLRRAMDADTWPFDWPKPRIMRDHPEYSRVIRKGRGTT